MKLNLLLVGMSGSGKTATLKSIAMTQDVDAQGGWESALGGCQQRQFVFGQRVINIVDSPGLFSTHMISEEDDKKQFQNSVKNVFQNHPEGFHALVLVLSYGRRFGQDDAQTMEILKEVLGANWLKTHGVALITCGDKFRRDLKGESFEARCRRIPGPMGEIFKECKYRCVLFDNVTEDRSVIQTQRNQLISVVDALGRTQPCFILGRSVLSSMNPSPSLSVPQSRGKVNLLLVGMSGSGKTATLKSIAMTEDVDGQGGWESALGGCQQRQVVFGQRVINIVDSPGLFSTHMVSEEGDKREFQNAINKAFQSHPEGFHALVLVLSYGRRFGQDDAETMEILKEVLGANWLKTHGVALITCGDKFRRDLKGESFEARCRRIPGPMGEIFKECKYRCVLFDNVTEDRSVIQTQRNQLISVVDALGKTQPCFVQNYRVKSSPKIDPSPGFFERTQEMESPHNKKMNVSKFEEVTTESAWGIKGIASKAFSEIGKGFSTVFSGGEMKRSQFYDTGNNTSFSYSSSTDQNQKSKSEQIDTNKNKLNNTAEKRDKQENIESVWMSWLNNTDQTPDQFETALLASKDTHVQIRPSNTDLLDGPTKDSVGEKSTPMASDETFSKISNIYPNLDALANTIGTSDEPNLMWDMDTDDDLTNTKTLAPVGEPGLNKESHAIAETKQRDHEFLLAVRKKILDICVSLQRDLKCVTKSEIHKFQMCLHYYESTIQQLKSEIESQNNFVYFEKSVSGLQRHLSLTKKEANNPDCLEFLVSKMEDNLHDVIDLLEKDLDGVLARWERIWEDVE